MQVWRGWLEEMRGMGCERMVTQTNAGVWQEDGGRQVEYGWSLDPNGLVESRCMDMVWKAGCMAGVILMV